jgi:hypothetical protein
MKLGKLALACAALCAAPAFALTPAQVEASGNLKEVWITGASAVLNNAFQGFATLCSGATYRNAAGVVVTNPGTMNLSVYLQNTGASALAPGQGAGNNVAYACTVNTVDGRAGAFEGADVVVYHTVEGGSFNAYTPSLRAFGDTNTEIPTTLTRTTDLRQLDNGSNCAVAAPATASLSISGQANNVRRYTNCARTTVTLATPTVAATVNVAGDVAPKQSSGGFSDTEYKINQTLLNIATSVDEVGTTYKTNVAQAFGVGVSKKLYRQLQKSQGLINTVADDGELCDTMVPGACQPSISTAQYASIASVASGGTINGAFFGGAAADTVQLLRRTPTSGTQSASSIQFLNNPCGIAENTGFHTALRRADVYSGNTPLTKLLVEEHSSSGNVSGGLVTAANNSYALGVLSMENARDANGNWAYVRLNGASPNAQVGLNGVESEDLNNRVNAVRGTYPMWFELEGFVPYEQSGGDGDAYISSVIASLGNPEITNLRGLFITGAAGVPANGANVSAFSRNALSCLPASKP